MMKGKLVLYPASILRRKCRQVKPFDKEAKKVAEELKKTLRETKISAGLAAPQLDYDLRIFGAKCYKCEREGGCEDINIYVNPKIVKGWGEKEYLLLENENGKREDFLEGCLSFPGLFGTVKRWRKIKVEYETLGSGGGLIKKKEELVGFEAIVFQHELDHLDGVLFLDHIENQGGKLFKSKKEGMEEIDPLVILVD
jgi:peptide deformylase